MLPLITDGQQVFIEITNPVHGGFGWELGICLWSPVFNKSKAKSWRLMEKVKKGDIILHLVDIKNSYHWYGSSIASTQLVETTNGPLAPTKWADNRPYQRINLDFFNKVLNPPNIQGFFDKYDFELRSILKSEKKDLFFVEYGTNKTLRMAQKYFARCPQNLYNLFNNFSNELNYHPLFLEQIFIPTQNEPLNPDYNSPGRVSTIISRILRDTSLSRYIKKRGAWKCQICGLSILLPNTSYYAEGHHLKPLGGISQGPDTADNIIVLCPTHHTEFDYGSIAINPINGKIEHIDPSNSFHNKFPAYNRNDLSHEFVSYHYNERYNKISTT